MASLGDFRAWMYLIGSCCGLQADVVSPDLRYLAREKGSGLEGRQSHMVMVEA